jgi:hypothetical protein
MIENKCCGSCKCFKDEDTEGLGWCTFNKTKAHCAQSWDCYNSIFNGWTKITSSKISEIEAIDLSRVVVAWLDNFNRMQSVMLVDCSMAITTMVKVGGYYYYVLPELRID